MYGFAYPCNDEVAISFSLLFPFGETLHRSAANGAGSLQRGSAVLHRHLVCILHLGFLFALDAICFSHFSVLSFSQNEPCLL